MFSQDAYCETLATPNRRISSDDLVTHLYWQQAVESLAAISSSLDTELTDALCFAAVEAGETARRQDN